MEWLAAFVTVVGGFIAVWKSFSKKASRDIVNSTGLNDDAYDFIQRFIQIYNAHGIELNQIPRFLGDEFGLTLADISTDEKLLAALNENLINKTCDVFRVRREWLDGKGMPIYPYLHFDKQLGTFIDFLTNLKQLDKNIQCLFVKCPQDKLDKGDERWPIAVVTRQEIDHRGFFNEDSIWKYYPLSDQYYLWGYERTRLQLKAMALICWQFSIHIGGCQLPKKDIEQVVAGTQFPGPLFEHLSHVAWHPDDYIFAKNESGVVADQEEALRVHDLLDKHGCIEKLHSLTGPLKIPFKSPRKHLA